MDNSRDAIIIADFEGNRSFVSAAGANWGGWAREEILRFRSLDLVHPDDLPSMKAIMLELRGGKDGALVECRARRRDGTYIWLETSLRTIRDQATGLPMGILNSVREIAERKRAEQQLAEAYRAVEALASTDALTGLSNRRRFDECIITEWRRALRDRQPLSLLLIDVDFFKSYNDTYGHLRGDYCLKQIATVAQDLFLRPADLVARFGGEEFAVILPSTPNQAAMRIAGEVVVAMRDRKLFHCANPLGVITVSAGCATLFPQLGQGAASLIECADNALYVAKRAGRNCACNYNEKDVPDLAATQSNAIAESKAV
jgi:diguanylate cyclase (GGDEF)-like protein/PAS domain S-box-containing protein